MADKAYEIKAVYLRDCNYLNKIPNDKPGYYKWWAQKNELKKILLTDEFYSNIFGHLEKNSNGYYCIYVGVAVKESIRARLNWHINQKHTESAVTSGFLSTFRKSISSLVAKNQHNEKACNDFIDKLTIEYFPVNNPTKSAGAKNYIHTMEQELINGKFVRPLNIQNNKNKHIQNYKKKLKQLRKDSK